MFFRQQDVKDLTSGVLSSSFGMFSMPAKDEGFDDIRYEWQKEPACKDYMKKWILEKKLTTRVEDTGPNEWFFNRHQEWQKILQEWQTKQKEFKSDPARMKAAKFKPQKTEGQEGQEGQEGMQVDGEGGQGQGEAAAAQGQEGEQGEAKQGEEGAEEDAAAAPAVDIFSVEDVCDMGTGEPLFSNFSFEDWALMSLRFELNLLIQAFRKDVNDPERPGMHEPHMPFYYHKYFRKSLNTKFFGKEKVTELIEMVKDTCNVGEHA
eukprot:CAMPEP_0195136632 /NCGR_PEP_ID=MMETSP0448-20130528/154575_1 /TAXON_ID=66468 /ORGANISM="Heterocapsa triquestra, Strain CCMP 448" /LENGTH=262 /DNA_ID=CAMNT_0040174829 /DNA_START=1 /DNA_END=786 /DNA_ORIENTATION=-